LNVEVVYCPRPGHCDRVQLTLPQGACLNDALLASGLCRQYGLQPESVEAGIWGRRQPPHSLLRANDRVEIYRPLRVDPKEARRQRYKRVKADKAAVAK
jgi:putative ubiquitin-RnfH superfamily antitoxin RatB of RatAB toxin-antitoxin module